ncbi:hypothetical protein [Streptomyces sp. ODS28]|uniref:hypothetical protein n=1 Tax=Streptomyces sp. ODS28 TaxID=3136688 RepID=UPI0031ED2EEC
MSTAPSTAPSNSSVEETQKTARTVPRAAEDARDARKSSQVVLGPLRFGRPHGESRRR